MTFLSACSPLLVCSWVCGWYSRIVGADACPCSTKHILITLILFCFVWFHLTTVVERWCAAVRCSSGGADVWLLQLLSRFAVSDRCSINSPEIILYTWTSLHPLLLLPLLHHTWTAESCFTHSHCDEKNTHQLQHDQLETHSPWTRISLRWLPEHWVNKDLSINTQVAEWVRFQIPE